MSLACQLSTHPSAGCLRDNILYAILVDFQLFLALMIILIVFVWMHRGICKHLTRILMRLDALAAKFSPLTTSPKPTPANIVTNSSTSTTTSSTISSPSAPNTNVTQNDTGNGAPIMSPSNPSDPFNSMFSTMLSGLLTSSLTRSAAGGSTSSSSSSNSGSSSNANSAAGNSANANNSIANAEFKKIIDNCRSSLALANVNQDDSKVAAVAQTLPSSPSLPSPPPTPTLSSRLDFTHDVSGYNSLLRTNSSFANSRVVGLMDEPTSCSDYGTFKSTSKLVDDEIDP